MITRRRLLTTLMGLTAGVFAGRQASAEAEAEPTAELRFPGDPTDYNVVYQFNKAEQDFLRLKCCASTMITSPLWLPP